MCQVEGAAGAEAARLALRAVATARAQCAWRGCLGDGGDGSRGTGLHPVMQANLVSFRDLDFILGELGPHGRI